ncbi:MAG: hypothetical protein JF563_01245, partial [Acidobacteriales bacterium]|nr:hypothetical protein [Terriglobales bacterium]
MMTTGLFPSGWAGEIPNLLLNHLWQSTAVLVVAWLLALALRNNSARVRYVVWLFASVKFLVPFQLLTDLGARLTIRASNNGAHFYTVVEEVTRPIRQAPVQTASGAMAASTLQAANVVWALIATAWFCGFVALLLRWISGWMGASRAVRAAGAMDCGFEFDALSRARQNARIQSPIRLLLS